MGRKLFDIHYIKIFYNQTLTIMKKNNEMKLDFKSFCISKENINNTNRQTSKWKKMFENKATNKE